MGGKGNEAGPLTVFARLKIVTSIAVISPLNFVKETKVPEVLLPLGYQNRVRKPIYTLFPISRGSLIEVAHERNNLCSNGFKPYISCRGPSAKLPSAGDVDSIWTKTKGLEYIKSSCPGNISMSSGYVLF